METKQVVEVYIPFYDSTEMFFIRKACMDAEYDFLHKNYTIGHFINSHLGPITTYFNETSVYVINTKNSHEQDVLSFEDICKKLVW